MENGRATLREVVEMLARIEDKLDKRLERQDAKIERIQDRVSSVERWRAWTTGVAAVLLFLTMAAVRVWG